MAHNPEEDFPTANEVLESMVFDSIGPDNPMTQAALDVASVEVGTRIDAAINLVHGDHTQQITGDMDTQAIYALLMLEIEQRKQ
ncbi:hypothetical protein EYC59_04435 [Candidatus Saccharibacteria bacterium]|nr:MAG: hypothetical protein EYC59_04435 [Candidatus Saccharibacteria bacterium]